jgi:hypothetical protein
LFEGSEYWESVSDTIVVKRQPIMYYLPGGGIDRASNYVTLPYWFSFLIAAAFAAAPWILQLRFHFSLRTLLIATTLVTVILGLVVYAAR